MTEIGGSKALENTSELFRVINVEEKLRPNMRWN